MITIAQREELRLAILHFLAPRHVCAFSAAQIEARLKAERLLDFACESADVVEACALLVKAGLAAEIQETSVSVVSHYQATAKGVFQSERYRLDRGMQ